jgi:hypothetical protein
MNVKKLHPFLFSLPMTIIMADAFSLHFHPNFGPVGFVFVHFLGF